MKRLSLHQITAIVILFILIQCFESSSLSARIKSRFFYSGDGDVYLVDEKTGAAYNGKYRLSEGGYNEKALKSIDRIFGIEHERDAARISLRLIEFLDFLQDKLHPGAKITIVSGWRSQEYNTKLRKQGMLAAKASLHQYGMAADIKIEGVPAKRIWNLVKKLKFGGAGYYHGESVHVDVGPARFWDENTSGVGTGLADDNRLIGIVTDFDIYHPKDSVILRFIRMTALPIGIDTLFSLEYEGKGGAGMNASHFTPSFSSIVNSQVKVPSSEDKGCIQFFNMDQMSGILWKLPKDIPAGLYKIRARFCANQWDRMPQEVLTPEFQVVPPTLKVPLSGDVVSIKR